MMKLYCDKIWRQGLWEAIRSSGWRTGWDEWPRKKVRGSPFPGVRALPDSYQLSRARKGPSSEHNMPGLPWWSTGQDSWLPLPGGKCLIPDWGDPLHAPKGQKKKKKKNPTCWHPHLGHLASRTFRNTYFVVEIT